MIVDSLDSPFDTAYNRQLASQNENRDPDRRIKMWIWAYFILIIIEGGLRKWLLPGLSTPLLLVRDPVALWIIFLAWRRGQLPSNIYLLVIVLITIIELFTSVLIGHGNLLVALFGARIFLLHFPLIFIIGNIFTREDVLKIGRVTLWIAIPMTLLIAAQFYSPQSALVNRGVGNDINGGGFSGALGFFRPPGTFSFISGAVLFYGMVACYVFYFWLNPENINRLLLIAATVCLLAAIPLSISRSVLSEVLITLLFALITLVRKPKYLPRVIIAGVLITAAIAFLSTTKFFQVSIEAFTSRFQSATEVEGGVHGVFFDRFLGGIFGALSYSAEIPFFGYGLGMGTNVGAKILTGDVQFIISEGEWGRLIGEMGAVIGLTVIFLRVLLSLEMLRRSYRNLLKHDTLAWMLLSFGFICVLQGQWGVPNILGFDVFIGGLVLSAIYTTNSYA